MLTIKSNINRIWSKVESQRSKVLNGSGEPGEGNGDISLFPDPCSLLLDKDL
jgi:hypothetical protein